MNESASALSAWESFYVIVGSSGGALIGLQFVVITLIAGTRHRRKMDAMNAFGTPTVVHLTGALLVSAIMSAPWPSYLPVSIALTICGLVGLAYAGLTVRRAQLQTDYAPVWEDWLWHAVLPCIAYITLTVSAAFLHSHPQRGLIVIGAAALGLLLVGIHNAWDSITHIVATSPDGDTT